MIYRVEHERKQREPFGDYRYSIYRNDQLIAYFWHDHRGDEGGVEFIDGRRESDPMSHPAHFLEGGGPHPLALSPWAISYLESKLATQ